MKNLNLSLIEVWFRLTEALIKKEDYRNITPYWCARFILVDGEQMPKKWWIKWFERQESFVKKGRLSTDVYLSKIATSTTTGYGYEFKKFTSNVMTLGYPSKTDLSRIKEYEHLGIEIGYGNPEWGAEPNKLYFVIKHGEEIKL